MRLGSVEERVSGIFSIKEGKERYGDLSYMLGGRSAHIKSPMGRAPMDIEKWKPNVTSGQDNNQVCSENRETGPATRVVSGYVELPPVWDIRL